MKRGGEVDSDSELRDLKLSLSQSRPFPRLKGRSFNLARRWEIGGENARQMKERSANPESAVDGRIISVKSNVFSFGVQPLKSESWRDDYAKNLILNTAKISLIAWI